MGIAKRFGRTGARASIDGMEGQCGDAFPCPQLDNHGIIEAGYVGGGTAIEIVLPVVCLHEGR